MSEKLEDYMNTARAFKLAKKIMDKTGQAILIRQDIWAFNTGQHQLKYQLTYFISPSDCSMEHFDKWSEVETFCKEKWDV